MKELVNLRKEREKHFLNDDGTITAYMYDEDIHYLDNGEYKEIDNTLIEESEYITNKNNNFKIKLYKNKYLVNIDLDNNDYLNTTLKNSFGVSPKIVNDEIIYEDVLPNVDFHYLIHGKSLKENIYLKEKINTNITFNIETNLKLVLENNKVLAKNNGKVIYTFEPLFMKDSVNNINRNCHYSLIENNGHYELELILDENYLANATYPVLVDPSINTDQLENVFDSTLFSDSPNHIQGDSYEYLTIGCTSKRVTRSLLKFVLPNLKTGDNIIRATAYLLPHSNNIFNELRPIGVYEVNTDWNENNASWNSMSDKYIDDIETYFYSTSPDIVGNDKNYTEIDLTNLVKSWYSGKTNNGVMLKLLDETFIDKDFNYSFYSKNYDALIHEGETEENLEAKRPILLVNYREQNGLLDYMTYETCELSKGTANINNCTGNLTTQISLDEILETNSLIDLNLTYNTGDIIANKDNKVGLGFNISYNETIIKNGDKTISSEYKYISSDGSVHYFYKEETPTENEGVNPNIIYKDEDGLDLVLQIVNDETKEYTIVDKNGNKFLFTNGYLSKIEYVDASSITITRDNTNKITKIVESKNNEVNISYEVNKITVTGKKSITINLIDNKVSSIVTKDGNISFTYDSHSLITKINDLTGMSIGFEYYETSPYRIKKVTQYGLNNTIGKYKTFEYGFYTTTVIDNNNQKYRYSFNRLGNTTSTMLVSKDGTLKNTFGFSESYVNELSTPNTNKLQSETLPLSYSENLLNNSSLESDEVSLFSNNRTTEEARSGLYSAKITTNTYSSVNINLPVDKSYVFSAYVKSAVSSAIKLFLYENEGDPDETETYEIIPSEEFERIEIPIYTLHNIREITVQVIPTGTTPVYIDDIQLEEGDVASTYNLLDNGNFKNDIYGWGVIGSDDNDASGGIVEAPYEIITLDSNEKALKLVSSITGSSTLSKTIPMNGKKGDVYTLSFIYKNEGILDSSDMLGNFAHLNFGYPDDPDGLYNHGTYDVYLNYHSKEWQMYNESFVAEEDYDSITIDVLSINEINSLYITNISLVKDLGSYSYKYDNEGNLISTYDVINNKTEFKYDKNNELTSVFDAKGNNFSYEYDNKITDRVLKGISPTGISNEMKYDEHGNVVKTIINNVNPKGSEISGNYYIRSKGTNKYVTPNLKTGELTLKEDTCSHYSFRISKFCLPKLNMEFNVIVPSILTTLYLQASDENNISIKKLTGTNLITRASFILEKRNNGSFYIRRYTKIEGVSFYLKAMEDNKLTLAPLEENNTAFEFYFEDIDTNEFIETSAKYTEDGKYITEVTDALGKKTTYNINTEKGLTASITNPKGLESKYLYDEKDRLKSVEVDNKKVEYTYENNLIKSIKSGNKTYSFEHDNFLNKSKVKTNNNTLVTNEYYENNGKLKSVTYGNGNKINYEYDEFNRLKYYDHFGNYYNNLGLLTQVASYDSIYEKYYYDFARRLSSYIYLDKFKMNYKYDVNSNVNHKEYTLFNENYKIDYEFNGDDSVIKVKFDNNSLNYDYDYLGRLKSRNINGNIPEYFTYKGNGNKTSLVVDTMKIGEDIYKYLYDDAYNITEILKNDEVLNQYTYDDRSQLLSDENHDLNKKYIYTYDNEGNILTKKEYDLETNTLVKTDTFAYGNTSWEDQLTKFNNESITYDAIGNPISIGSKILSWNNGRQLSSYKDGNTQIDYTYNQNGIRTVKEFGEYGEEGYINYYLEGTKIIFEERCKFIDGEKETDMLYYIYDDSGNVLGFKYNEILYYYQKNYQNDVIGIYDSNYNLVVTYQYDAWGKIVSINDNTTNNIGTINPFRYRSYYYDEETKLYYLNSRYYNPEWCRFINADGIISANQDIFSLNLYTYVSNNPVIKIDNNGTIWGLALAGGGTLSSGIGAGAAILGGALVVGGLLVVGVAVAYQYYTDNAYTRPQTTKVTDKTNKNKGKNQKRNNSVYGLYDKEGNMQYAGRTNDTKRRKAAHHRNPKKKELTFYVIEDNLTLEEARKTEQTLIKVCGTLKRDDIRGWSNRINSIGPNGSLYSQFVEEYEDIYNHLVKINPNGVCKWKE